MHRVFVLDPAGICLLAGGAVEGADLAASGALLATLEIWDTTMRVFWVCIGLLLTISCVAACAPAATPSTERPSPVFTQPAVATKAPANTQIPAASETAAVLPTPMMVFEERRVELEWPARIRLGDSDTVRLELIPNSEGYTVTSEFPEHKIESHELTIKRLGGYQLSAIASLDGAGFDISPRGEREQVLDLQEAVGWHWSISPSSPGQQRLIVTLGLHWVPAQTMAGPERHQTIYSRGMDVQVSSFFGLTRQQTMTGGMAGLIFGAGISLFSLASLVQPVRKVLKRRPANLSLVVELATGFEISPAERNLLRALFHPYARLALVKEFLSGYSGARTFMALPVREDGRADAYTIVKLGQSKAICREFDNYETFVKDRLPPVTARIQHPPVALPLSSRGRGKSDSSVSDLAAIRYTFIGTPGSMPRSLRQALLEQPDPELFSKLFQTFGPNWWMQRRPYSFRLAYEYDRLLPAHLLVEPTTGRGHELDGSMNPDELNFKVGDSLTLRHFERWERRQDGKSLTLFGQAAPGRPPLRIRWLGLENPNGNSGKVVATRDHVLHDASRDFKLLGLADPVQRLPALLKENISGTQSTIHGDLNLENILAGPGDFVWLIDFAMTREGHTLYDFAHLEADVIAHILGSQLSPAAEHLSILRNVFSDSDERLDDRLRSLGSLLSTLHCIAGQCLFNPAQPHEYHLALFMACMGAIKYRNLNVYSRQLLVLTAAYLGEYLLPDR